MGQREVQGRAGLMTQRCHSTCSDNKFMPEFLPQTVQVPKKKYTDDLQTSTYSFLSFLVFIHSTIMQLATRNGGQCAFCAFRTSEWLVPFDGRLGRTSNVFNYLNTSKRFVCEATPGDLFILILNGSDREGIRA